MDIQNILQELQKRKEDGHIAPTHILDVHLHSEILKQAKAEINDLVNKGVIGKVETINNAAYYVRNDRE